MRRRCRRSSFLGMGRIGLVHLEAITKAPGVTPVIVSNPTVSKAEVSMTHSDEDQHKIRCSPVALAVAFETEI